MRNVTDSQLWGLALLFSAAPTDRALAGWGIDPGWFDADGWLAILARQEQ